MASWQNFFAGEKEKSYYHELREKVDYSYLNAQVYPPKEDIFRAFNITELDSIKVVILGQDPYHNGQATGLAFSVHKGDKLPASLRNIFKELKFDLGIDRSNGDLTDWAEQGVFLLNTALTVEAHKPASHAKIGWNTFTENTIKYLSETKDDLIWVLWGKHAQSYEHLMKGKIIKSPHPSPFSANRGFFESRPFSQINDILKSQGKETIKF